jgi:hypothetical protein
MNTAALRGQTSVAMLEAPSEWQLPNVIGLPMAAHHAVIIRNDDPQIFQHQGRTMRTPQVELIDLGTGHEQGISRRTNLKLRPGIGFITGPQYVQNLDILGGNFNFHDNPLAPTVVTDGNDNGGLFVEIDMRLGNRSFQDKGLLFDTGADLTVISQIMAARLGFDAVLDSPDFFLQVEGSGGVSDGVPGIFIDELNIDTVGGSFTLTNVPVAVLDVADPTNPGNIIDGIIGMHLFNDRNLVIDANPAVGQGGVGPSLYISDPVTQTHHWANASPTGDWSASGNWSAPGTPNVMWDVQVRNVSGADQFAHVSENTTANRLTVAGGANGAEMTVGLGAMLTVFGEVLIEEGGRINVQQGLDAQFVNIDGGTLTGEGQIFVGTGPVNGVVRNISGRVEPSAGPPIVPPIGKLDIIGDFANLPDGTLAIDLNGTATGQHDIVTASRFAFLGGTLEVSLVDSGVLSFTPSVGDMFTVLTAGEGVVGQFDHLVLPSGFQWNVAYTRNSVVLSVIGLGLAGDYNADGAVDASDYIVWRNSMGAMGSSLPADGNGDQVVNLDDYTVWRSNFGQSLSSAEAASAAPAAVPEPVAQFLATLAACGLALTRRRR